ncbi:MAG: hypothetical protein JSU65_04345 [Candidatus Zixiibacteriota bacterium]|nr:MAG: hypothetical protein JSU65_04345 [candidate division Zixibacteria bacterium]
MLFIVTVTTAFALGLYSLFLASANAGKVQPLTTVGLLRTASAADAEKIEIALGVLTEHDLVYVVLDAPELGPDPYVERATRTAAEVLTDSGLVVAVRSVNPANPDFTTIVVQNDISRFPSVLVVKREGGIVLVSDNFSVENLLHAYQSVWGKTSGCGDAASAIY